MKVVKVGLAVFGSLIALLLIAGSVLFWLFDPNAYKGYVAELVTERTGRSFAIEDDLELSFFPWLAVETGGLTFGNADGFGEQPMATIERASARVKLLPLLKRRVEIGTVALDGVQLDLARDTGGRNNWSDLLDSNATADESAGAAGDSNARVEALGIEGVRIRGGRIVWRENGNDVRYIVNDLRFVTGPIAADAPTDVEIELRALEVVSQRSLDLDGSATAQLGPDGALLVRDLSFEIGVLDGGGATRLSGELALESLRAPSDGTLALGALTLSGRAFAPPIGRDELDLSLRFASAAFDPDAQSLEVDGLTTRIGGIEAEWRLAGQSLLDTPQLVGGMTIASAPLTNLVDTFELALPAGVSRATLGNASVSTSFRGTPATGQVALDDLDVRLLGARVQGRASLESSERLTANLDVPAFAVGEPLRALLAAYLPEDIDASAFERIALRGAVDANLSSGALSVRDLNAELLGATVTGQLEITRPAAGTLVQGALKSTRFAPGPFVRAFNAILTDTVNPQELGTLAFDTRFSYDPGNDAVTLDPLALEVFGLSASGNLRGSSVSTVPAFQGRAQVAQFAPRDLLRRFNQTPPQTSDETALRSASIATRFDITPELGRFDDLVLVLDDSRITGSFIVDDFDDPSYRFTLAADRLDVDRYLPPPADEVADGERAAGDLALSADALKVITIAGQAQVGDLKLAGLSFQQVAATLDFGAGKADIGPARANLYGGAFTGSLNVDTTGELPTMSLSGQATTLALEPLIEALAGESNFTGTGNFDIRLTGRGPTVTDTVRTAAGTMSFALRDGVISGFNLGRTLCQVYNSRAGLPAPPQLPATTSYQLIQGSANVADGLASMPDLLARAAFMDITGRGRLTLVDQQLDFSLESKLTRSLGIQGCESLDGMVGDAFPWTLKGTVTDAEILPDFSKYLRQRVEDEIKDRARERLEERLQDRLRNLL